MPKTEAELLALAKQGDRAAFNALVTPYRDRLWAVCLRTTRHRADAEDALQDCLIAAWQNLSKFRGESGVGTWMFRIASNASLAIVRRRREVLPEEDSVFENVNPSRDHANKVADQDRVQRALKVLPEDFRVALVLREYGDYSYQEIADYQQVGVQTVKSRLNRARTMLQRELGSLEG